MNTTAVGAKRGTELVQSSESIVGGLKSLDVSLDVGK